jgi:hypothetical protein
MTLIRSFLFALALVAALAVPALAENPHCDGNSDNVNLPSGHVNNFPAC